MSDEAPSLFWTRRRIAVGLGVFVGLLVAGLVANEVAIRIAKATNAYLSTLGGWFPVSVGFPRIPFHEGIAAALGRPGALAPPFGPAPPGPLTIAGAVALVAGLWWLLRTYPPTRAWQAAALAGLLILGTTLLQTPSFGFSYPIDGDCYGGMQYYHDAVEIDDAPAFVRGYVERQRSLRVHTKVHPPGAVLTVWALLGVLGHPAAVALVLCLVTVVLLAWGMVGVLRDDVGPEAVRFGVLLLLLVPAVQIYGCATIDGPIAALMLLTLAAFRAERTAVRIGGATAGLFLASSLTFPTLFLLPVLAGYELLTRRSVRDTSIVVAATVALHGVVFAATGFNWLASFAVASAVENPEGFRLLSHPLDYLWTRVEATAEVAMFAGPFLLWALGRRLRVAPRSVAESPLELLAALGLLTFGLMLLAGAYRLGETARTCLYLYPFLVLPVVSAVDRGDVGDEDRRRLLALVFAQTAAMQTFGFYVW